MKCTPFCPVNCKRRHHPVLLSLIDAKCYKSLENFKCSIETHKIAGLNLSEAIPDPDPSFRYPILHWAGVLGKVEVIEVLLQPPYNIDANLRCIRQETVLHRSLLGWAGHINIDTMFNLIKTLEKCLNETDIDKQNPFHVCANLLINCNKKDLSFWRQIFYKMMAIKDNYAIEHILNSKDVNGDTVLHILVKRECLISEVEYAVCCGGNIQEKNYKGETPVELAWRSSTNIFNLLNMLLNSKDRECEIRTRVALGLSETIDYTEFFTEDNDAECSNEEDIPKRKIRNPRLVESIENLDVTKNHATTERKFKRRRVMFIESESDDGDDDLKTMKELQETKNSVKSTSDLKNKKEFVNNQNFIFPNCINGQEIKSSLKNSTNTITERNYVPDQLSNPILSCHPRYKMLYKTHTKEETDEKSKNKQSNEASSQRPLNASEILAFSVTTEEHQIDENLLSLKNALIGYGIDVDFDNYQNYTADDINKEIQVTVESIQEMHLEKEINDDERYQEFEEKEIPDPTEECKEVNQRIKVIEQVLFHRKNTHGKTSQEKIPIK